MKQYSIGAISKLTGLTVHNLRVWEKRHAAITTSRTNTGRRLYDDSALQRLKLLKNCVDNGFAIGTIAAMSDAELQEILLEFETTPPPKTKKPSLHMVVVGGEPAQLVTELDQLSLDPGNVSKLKDLQELQNYSSRQQIDFLIIEQATLSAEETRQLSKLIKNINAVHSLIFYRYCRQQDVSFLKSIGVHTLKSPVDKIALQSLLTSLLEAPQGEPLLQPIKKVLARIFSDQALINAANMSSSIDCECPKHLSELIKSLAGFETYSADCEIRDKTSADLHHHIYLRTAQARAILEDLLETVLQQEGIDISRLNHT